MSMFSRILNITILCVLSAEFSFALKSDMTFHYLTADDGLSQNKVYCVLRDSKNYVWFGTEDGLDRYDGSQLEVYKNDPKNPKSICGNRIVCIAEDTEKNIWIGSYDGLSLYIPDDDSFISFRNNPSDRNSISSNIIDCIFADTKQNLWIGVDGKEGLNKWNPDSKTFTRYQVVDSERKVQANTITDIVQDKKGNIWLASSACNGIIRFEPDKTKFTFYTNASIPASKMEKLLFVDNDNIIWISTFGAGLFSFGPSNNNFTKYNSLGDGKGTNGNVITNIIQEDNNNLLIGVDQGGINRFNKQTKLFEYISHSPNRPTGLNNNGIWYLHKDKEGILWVGTSGGGVNICNPKSEKFKLLKNIPGKPNSLSYDVIGSIYEDSKGLIWINTDGGGISVYNPKTGNFKNYKNNPNDQNSIPWNVIRHTVEDKNHDYWSGTWDGGLIKLNHKTGKFTQYLPESKRPYNISGRNVWYNVVDHDGIIWLSIYKIGIDLLDPDRGIIEKYRSNPDLKGSLWNNIVHFMYEDSRSNMWLCTSDELSMFDRTTNSFKVYNIFPEREAIKSFIEDKEGCYWAGASNTGLIRFKLDGTVLKTYNTSNGLHNNTINGILEDNNNNLWISTNDGISRINYKTEKNTELHKKRWSSGKSILPAILFKNKIRRNVFWWI